METNRRSILKMFGISVAAGTVAVSAPVVTEATEKTISFAPPVELREFVRGALKDVVLAIQDAQKEEGIGNYIAPEGIGGHQFPANSGVSHSSRFVSTVIQFDVAVTAERSKTGGGSGRIAVVEAKLGGEAETKDTTVSRIRFSVPILMPAGV